ncbi:DNA-binding protein [Streptococcus suis]|nr:DNA-binding protein [Streptococcus suis]
MLKIKYVPVENCEAEWGDKMALIKRFEGLKLKTLNNLLTEMRLHPSFAEYVINSGHRTVWINFNGFLMFLRFRQNKRYKEVS